MEEVVIDSLLRGGHLRDPQRSMEREAGRFGPEQRIQLDGSSRASHGGFRSLTSFISLEVGSSEPSGYNGESTSTLRERQSILR